MKANLMKHLIALEAVADRVAVPPLRLVDVLAMDQADRDAYWSGDDAVLTRHGALDGNESTPGTIHTLVISLHPESRQEWLTTRDMDDDDLEAYEPRTIREDARRNRKREAQAEQERQKMEVMDAKVRYDYSGYPIIDDGVVGTPST